ncbi:ribosomal biogenesis regulatory protein [Durotheca rogersii]|uniref:ribosomal biogenesis regulatory protein n=1 Tax=Durotheca rogersii TaxID=419775 RepID=UPI00221FBB85|nr:ribosomal biogenesis regulatory protein [Durotheca rogersii]KAI5866555.1 ribosomal biogenesis regulatory protein [Durotheca rogersii]
MAPPKPKLDVAVSKPTPYTFDLGLLLANDPNPILTSASALSDDDDDADGATSSASAPAGAAGLSPASARREALLAAVARDGAQALVNQLLTTVPLAATRDGVLLSLPAPSTPLPREKRLPPPKEPTKWERFAARKGIRPQTREQRRAKALRYNEAAGRWERTWGYDRAGTHAPRRRDGAVPPDWLVEVDEKKEREDKEAREKDRRKKKKKKGKT